MKCEEHYEQSAAILKKGKLKSTGARLKLMDILKHAKKPLSVSDIFVLLKDKKADKVTLYRNVEALAELGVLKQIRLKDRQAYYELVEKNHHHHIIFIHYYYHRIILLLLLYFNEYYYHHYHNFDFK